jgi:hypothetical protein
MHSTRASAQLRDLGEKGHFTVRLNEGARREIVIEAQMLKDVPELEQESLLGRLRCPVSIIHGDADEKERQLLENACRGLRYLQQFLP